MVGCKSGDVYVVQSRFGSAIVYAELMTGAENSGRLSTRVRRIADEIAEKNGATIIIIDGLPGISCPAVAAAIGVDVILFVTEPTLSGLSDLGRALGMAERLQIPAFILLNRADINPVMAAKVEELSASSGSTFLGHVPLSSDFVAAVRAGKTVLETTKDRRIVSVLGRAWQSVVTRLQDEK